MAGYVRRDVWSLAPDDPVITAYAAAVGTMQGRDPGTVTSWAYQGAIHGTYTTPAQALWNCCEHGTWYFLPWHRLYLHWFEQIVREAVAENGGPADWALPYWNYTESDGGNPALPPAFRDPDSPLYVAQRRTAPYDVNAGDPIPAPATLIETTLATPTFEAPDGAPPAAGFGGLVRTPIHFARGFGAIELQPHNAIHNAVGGPGGWMADPNLAALDPIFWLHHANVDRLWASWNAAARPNPTQDGRWAGQEFSFFAADRTEQARTCGWVDGTLDYTYDRLSPVPPPTGGGGGVGGTDGVEESIVDVPSPRSELVGASRESVTLTGRRTTGSLAIDRRAHEEAVESVTDGGGGGPSRVFLSLDDIEGERNPGTVYGVYVNLPEGATEEDAEAHLAGALSFFGLEHVSGGGDDSGHTYSAGFDITALVARLSERGLWDAGNVHVTFHPLGVAHGDDAAEAEDLPEVTVGRISVHYT